MDLVGALLFPLLSIQVDGAASSWPTSRRPARNSASRTDRLRSATSCRRAGFWGFRPPNCSGGGSYHSIDYVGGNYNSFRFAAYDSMHGTYYISPCSN